MCSQPRNLAPKYEVSTNKDKFAQIATLPHETAPKCSRQSSCDAHSGVLSYYVMQEFFLANDTLRL